MATAHAIPTLEVSTADDMDIHSDNDFDFNDGDIELDLEPPPTHGQDDDVSINDAASVHEADAQAVPDEQDDFMVDSEDIIEEDYDEQGSAGVAATDQPSISNAFMTQAQTPVAEAEIDEDLIDYSDEYDTPVAETQTPQSTAVPRDNSTQDDHTKEQDIQQDEIPADMKALMSVDDNKLQTPHAYVQNAVDHTAEGQEDGERHHSSRRQSYHSVGDNEKDVHTDSGDGGILLQGQQEFADNESDHGDATYEDYVHDESREDNQHQDQDASGLPSVTVNYEGNELWLFKSHDHDDSGDWLIGDISLAKGSMSDLFQACRSSLGDDVSNESEIGFRFDHLHNMELYEDNTACVAVSLERLVTYYHTLLAQDGVNEPDSFYVSLMFRPRFATLLSDIAKFAEQGSGYAALEAAVAAGDTHFNAVISSASSDEPTEWGNEEEEEEQANGDEQEQANRDVQEQADQGEQEQAHDEEQEYVAGEAQQEEHEGERAHEDDDGAQENYEGEAADAHKSKETSAEHEAHDGNHSPQTANTQDVPTNDQTAVTQPAEQGSPSHSDRVPAPEPHLSLPDDDLIDYTDEDEEDLLNAQKAGSTPAHETSSSSATVRGDDSANAEEHHYNAGSPQVTTGQEEQDDQAHNEVGLTAGEEPDAQSGNVQPKTNDEAEELYQDYEEAYDEKDPSHGFQADGTEEYPLETQSYGDANQDFGDYDYQDLDQQLELDFMNGDEFNAAGDTQADGNIYTGTEDFLDLDNPEWTADQEPDTTLPHGNDDVYAQDEEDGAAEHTANAASSAADPTTALSVDTKSASPQGQKRSIDEAGHGADIAPDSIGTFICFPSRKRFMGANFFLPDAKRPRV
jgi:hypothetical protein